MCVFYRHRPLLKFPQGAGEIYIVKDLAGTVIWQAPFEYGDTVWVLPGIYTMDLVERVGWRVYDSYLRSQGVEEGVRSYSRVIELIVRARRAAETPSMPQ